MSDGVFRIKPRRRTPDQKSLGTLSKAGTQTLLPPLTTNTSTFSGPKLNLNLKPSLFTDPDGFFAANLFNGKTLLISLFTNDQIFFDHIVHPGPSVLSPDLFTDGDTFYGPKVSHGLRPSLFVNPNVFSAPNVFLDSFVDPPLVVNPNTIFTPLIAFGQYMTASLVVNPNAFGNGTIVKRVGFSYSFAKASGAYKTADLYVKRAGVWEPVLEAWVKQDGQWHQVYASHD